MASRRHWRYIPKDMSMALHKALQPKDLNQAISFWCRDSHQFTSGRVKASAGKAPDARLRILRRWSDSHNCAQKMMIMYFFFYISISRNDLDCITTEDTISESQPFMEHLMVRADLFVGNICWTHGSLLQLSGGLPFRHGRHEPRGLAPPLDGFEVSELPPGLEVGHRVVRMVAVLGWDSKQRGFLNSKCLKLLYKVVFFKSHIRVGPSCGAIFWMKKLFLSNSKKPPFPGVSQWKRSNLEADALGGLVGAAQHRCCFLNLRLRFMKKKWCTASFPWFSLTQCSVHIINSSYAHHPSRFYETSMNFHDTL